MGCSQRRLNFFHDFHAKGYFEKSFNAMFVAVIPKKSGAVDIKDFLLICLVSGVYKVLANILENKLKVMLEKVISKNQNAFVRRSQILDLVLIINKCLS